MMPFGDLPREYREYDSSAVVVLPVPYDGTSTWIKGADRGPEALLEASAHMELYDIARNSEPYLVGIHTAAPVTEASSPEAMVEATEQRVSHLIDAGKFVVTLGGEHSVSVGAIRAHHARHPNLTVLQIDAHTDLRDEYEGSRFNHACVMARARELGPIVQVGIRSMDREETVGLDRARVFFAHDIVGRPGWQERVIPLLTDRVYLTIDLDGFDPSIVPSTGTPEPGGLGWYEVLRLLELVFNQRVVVGFDVVELCPNPQAPASDFLACKLIYQMLAMKFAGSTTTDQTNGNPVKPN